MTNTKREKLALIDKPELARQCKVSIHLVHKWVQENKVPYYKIGTLVRFDLDEVIAHFAKTAKEDVKTK